MSRLWRFSKQAALVGLVAFVVSFAGAYPRGSEASQLMATAPSLGSAASFAVLGGSTVTNTGSTVINGNLGVWPGSAITGFPPGTVTGGTIHKTDAVAQTAQSAVTTAYNALANQPCTRDLTGKDLGGMTLTPGVYCFSSSAQLTGVLTLDGGGDPNAVFVFKMGSTLTTASNSRVLLTKAASACNIFWQVGSSATLGTTTKFLGNILALTSITLNNGANVSGRALARNGAVTMNTNSVSSSVCVASTATPVPPTPTVIATPASSVATSTPTTAPPPSITPTSSATSTPAITPTSSATSTPSTTPKSVPTTAPRLLPTTLPRTGGIAIAPLLALGAGLVAAGWTLRRSRR